MTMDDLRPKQLGRLKQTKFTGNAKLISLQETGYQLLSTNRNVWKSCNESLALAAKNTISKQRIRKYRTEWWNKTYDCNLFIML